MTALQTVKVDIGSRSYDILIGTGLLAQAGSLIGPVLSSQKAIVLTDDHVGPLYADKLLGSLKLAGISCPEAVVIPSGEASKSFAMVERLASRMLAGGIDRSTTLIALGGGVVGDLGGFLASILLRGIDFVQIPTTLMAQVDSSVGGKTGINAPEGKNLVGSFWQPKIVVIDTDMLATLPQREVLAGYAEMLKYGLINDPEFFAWLKDNGREVLAGDAALQRYAIGKACLAKAMIVGKDERETGGVRALLNLGHSFGHALESLAGYDGSLLHGEAVGIGMSMAFDFSVRLGLCPVADATEVKKHLKAMGVSTDRPADPRKMLDYMQRDKKSQNGQIKLVLVRGIGKAFVSESVDEKTLLKFLEEYQTRDD